MENSHNEPKYIEVRGARVHNLKNVNVNVPLHQIVGIAGVSGSGKTTMVLESLIPGRLAEIHAICQDNGTTEQLQICSSERSMVSFSVYLIRGVIMYV